MVTVFGIALMTALSVFGFTIEKDIHQLVQKATDYTISQTGQVAGAEVGVATLMVDRGQGNTLSFDVEVEKDMTVFEALQQMATASGLKLQTKKYDFGVLVEGIGDLIGGQDNKYWLFYVNGEMALNSVDTQIVSPGDKIEFRFEESSF